MSKKTSKPFESFAGEEFDFYGVCGTLFKLGATVWEAIEDENDGYRSYLDSVVAKPSAAATFFSSPIARVRLTPVEDIRGYVLIDVADGHQWLEIGTEDLDDYYPSFTFRYSPKPLPHGSIQQGGESR